MNAHPTSIKRAEEVWKAHAGLGEVLSVPLGGPERMESFPALEGKDFELQGIGVNEGYGAWCWLCSLDFFFFFFFFCFHAHR